jgi:hypothetical protein
VTQEADGGNGQVPQARFKLRNHSSSWPRRHAAAQALFADRNVRPARCPIAEIAGVAGGRERTSERFDTFKPAQYLRLPGSLNCLPTQPLETQQKENPCQQLP